MFTAFLIVAIIAAVGTRAADGLRVRQQEVILANLPEADARAYYEILRRRVRRVAVLRVVAIISVVALFYCYKARIAPASRQPPAIGGQPSERKADKADR